MPKPSPEVTTNKLLADWKRQSPRRDETIQGIRTRILQLGMLIARANEQIARGMGVTGPEMRVLFALRRAGKPFQLRPTDLFESLLVPSSSMTRQLDRLEVLQLIRRLEDPNDGRGSLVELTAIGVEHADAALAAALEHSDVTRALRRLSAPERDSLHKLLELLQRQLGETS